MKNELVCRIFREIADILELQEVKFKPRAYRNAARAIETMDDDIEDYFGGCVSTGRGFAHVTPAGDLTPCPISTVTMHNLTRSTLHEGLASPLFAAIRENEELLETDGMPCALFAHPQEVDALAKAVGAYRTNE